MSLPKLSCPYFAAFLMMVGSGCGPALGKVEGTVTFEDKAVTVGSINLMDGKGHIYQSELKAEGRYVIDKVPYGTLRVAVVSLNPQMNLRPLDENFPPEVIKKKKSLPKKDNSAWFEIPERYAQFEESNLSLTVDKAIVIFDVKMTSGNGPLDSGKDDKK